MSTRHISPYAMEEQPTSTGKALLARAFEHWCVLHHGYSADEITAALEPSAAGAPGNPGEIRVAARLLGELLAAERMKAFVRPFGGGNPAPLPSSVWERDDFRSIFARSSIDPTRPFDDAAPATHWVFVDLADFNRVLEQSCGVETHPADPRHMRTAETGSAQTAVTLQSDIDHVRMPELQRRTGMSRATIYRRIREGRFPDRIPMDGNIASWREADVAEWLASPR